MKYYQNIYRKCQKRTFSAKDHVIFLKMISDNKTQMVIGITKTYKIDIQNIEDCTHIEYY